MEIVKKRLYILGVLKEYWGRGKNWLFLNIVCCILIRISSLIIPIFYGLFIEKVILAKNIKYLVIVIIGYILTQIVQSAFSILSVKSQFKTKKYLSKKLRVKVLNQYFSFRMDKYASVNTGDVKMEMEDDVEKVSSFIQKQSIDFFLNCIVACMLAAILLILDWRLALIAIASIPVTLFLDYLVGRKEGGVNDILNNNDSGWGTWLDEAIKNLKEIRVYQLAENCEKEFAEFQYTDEKFFSTWLRCWVSRTLVIPKIKNELILKFMLYFLGGILIYHRIFTIGTLLVFVQYYSMMADSVKALSEANASLQSDMPFIDKLLSRISDSTDIRNDGEKIAENYNIQFDKVSFGYDENLIFDDFSLQIKEGERIGIKGESGAGKSTLVKLLLGIIMPNKGQIRYGMLDLKCINTKELYKHITYISQESILLNDTIKNNLLIGKPDASTEEIMKACKDACLNKYIDSLPEGYDTVIGENGCNLSGGQRQRLMLARAFLRDSDVYVFDEVTSALDGATEEELCNIINQIDRNKTIIIISHRNTLFKACDRVISIPPICAAG